MLLAQDWRPPGSIAHAGGGSLLALELAAVAGIIVVASTVPRRRDRLVSVAGALTLALLASPPVHAVADGSVAGHMAQHLGLQLAALLIAAGLARSPIAQVLTGARGRSRRRVSPVVAASVHLLVIWAWHVPALYDLAVDSPVVHAMEHMTIVATGVAWWIVLLHAARRPRVMSAICSLFVVAVGGAALGVSLVFAPPAWYELQRSQTDVQIAGAMLGVFGVLYASVAFVLTARAIGRLGRPQPRRIPQSVAVGASSVVALGVVMFGVSAQPSDATGPVSAGSNLAERGGELYRRDCVACHGAEGEGTARGIAIDDVGTSGIYYMVSTGRMPIDEPDDRVERSEPAYDDDDVEALVTYTAGFVDGPSAPGIPSDEGSEVLPAGGELYRLHCAGCHGSTGIGGGQSAGRSAPPVFDATRAEAAAAIVAGPGGMPSFRAEFDDDEVVAVTKYVEYLASPEREGIPISGGRVGEGLVAWLISGVLLVAFATRIARGT